MDSLFESGLFSELEGVVGCDPVLYEDTQKQHYSYSHSPVHSPQDAIGKDISSAAVDGSSGYFQSAESGELDCLLAENNQLLEQLMRANGLELPTEDPIDLADVDEVSAKLDYLDKNMNEIENPQDLLADLERLSESLPLPMVSSPASSIDTLPSEPSSPIDLFPYLESIDEKASDPSEELTDTLQSILDDSGINLEGFGVHSFSGYQDEPISSPVSSELSYTTYASVSTADDSWVDDASSTYSSCNTSNAPGKVKPKKKSQATPYSKLPAGRKERKKKQNKEAAIRYREKKRKEALEAHSEEAALAKKNNDLKTEVLNLEREIMCMKELLLDVFNVHSL